MLRTEEALYLRVLKRSVLLERSDAWHGKDSGGSLLFLLFQTPVWSESCKENVLAINILFDILFLYTELNPPQLFIREFYLGLRVAGTPAG